MSDMIVTKDIPDLTGLTIGTVRNYRATGRLPDADEMIESTPRWKRSTIVRWNDRRNKK